MVSGICVKCTVESFVPIEYCSEAAVRLCQEPATHRGHSFILTQGGPWTGIHLKSAKNFVE